VDTWRPGPEYAQFFGEDVVLPALSSTEQATTVVKSQLTAGSTQSDSILCPLKRSLQPAEKTRSTEDAATREC